MTAHTEHQAVYTCALSIDKAILDFHDQLVTLTNNLASTTNSLTLLQGRWFVRYGLLSERLLTLAAIAALVYALWRLYRLFKPTPL